MPAPWLRRQADWPSAVGSTDSTEPSLKIRALAGLGRALTALGKPALAAAAFGEVVELAPLDRMVPEIALARAAPWRPASKQMPPSSPMPWCWKSLRDQIRRLRPPWHKRASTPKSVASIKQPAQYDRLVGDAHARTLLNASGVGPDVLLSEYGWILLDADKVAEADQVFTRLLKDYPASPHTADARFNLAESANLAHNHAEVIRLLGPLTTMKLAGASPDQGRAPAAASGAVDNPAAVEALRRVLPAALYRLGRTQVELKEWPAAASTLDRLLAEFPDNPYRREARYLRAESALRLGDVGTAEKGFGDLLAEPPAMSDPKGMIQTVRLKRIQSWVALKRWKDALDGVAAEKGRLAPGDPSIAELDYVKGQALLGLGRIAEAPPPFRPSSMREGGRAGRPVHAHARGNLLPPGSVPRGTPRFSPGRHPARLATLAGGGTPRGRKSL